MGAVAVAVVAVGTGVAVDVRRTNREPDADDPAPADVWSLAFPTADGAPIAMAGLRGRPLLLNFWATWCVPCAVEMPLLDVFASTNAKAGWRVLALAVDDAEPVRRFVRERKLQLPVALAGVAGISLSRTLGNRVGALPFTVIFDATGAVRDRRLGALDEVTLTRWANDA